MTSQYIEHKHFFKDMPYKWGDSNGWFYQTGKRLDDGRVVYWNDKTLEVVTMSPCGDGKIIKRNA